MDIGEIIGDAIAYPLNNIKSMILFVILGIIAALLGGATVVTAAASLSTGGAIGAGLGILDIIGLIVFILIVCLIEGYGLDIIKFGIERRADGPGIDIGRQISNAIKLIIVNFVYYIIPAIIIAVLGLFLKNWLIGLIGLILAIVFALANFMAKCRLAKTDSLGEALAIGEAIGDISRVGLFKIIATVILLIIIITILLLILGFIYNINKIIGGILFGIAIVYIEFFYNRAIGLLYSNV